MEKRTLSKQAYHSLSEGEEYRPVIGDEERISEFSWASVGLGIILAVVFGMANAYLGLKVGMTVSASIPAAVISMAILRGLFKRGTILENNMAQTVGSAGESLAAGVIFTIPSLILLNLNPSMWEIFVMSLLGGIMGILFMIPLRKYLISKEHGKLPYPEGTACAEVIVAGEAGGDKAKIVFLGVFIGGLYKFLMSGWKMWVEKPEWSLPKFKNLIIGFDSMPALLAVGYIIGPKIAAYMLAGGLLGWWVFIPLITFLGADLHTAVYPATKLISQMDAWGLWDNYLRYIGAGAVAFGGMISLIGSLPTIFSSFGAGFKELVGGMKTGEEANKRTKKDIPMIYVLIGIFAIFIALRFLPKIPGGFLVPLLMVIFTFFFVTVSSRIVGIVGSSSNPVSGMTIATLLITSYILYKYGYTGNPGIIAALSIGAVVCIALAIAGDTSQDLKTGFLVGATPWKQQVGEMLGVLFSAMAIGYTVYLLHHSYSIGSEALPAPQAQLMAMVVKGVMENSLPWALVFVGAASALVAELMGVPSLAFAVGLYLPLHLSTPIIIGGLIKGYLDKKYKDREENDAKNERGILYASGLIAGEALTGVIIASIVAKWSGFFPKEAMNNSPWISLIMLSIVTVSMIFVVFGGHKKKE